MVQHYALGSRHISKRLIMNITTKIHDSFDLSCQGNFTQFLDGNAQNGKHYGHLHIPFE